MTDLRLEVRVADVGGGAVIELGKRRKTERFTVTGTQDFTIAQVTINTGVKSKAGIPTRFEIAADTGIEPGIQNPGICL